MRVSLPLMLCAALATTGCARVAESRMNPLNWFGKSTSAPLTASGELRPLVPTKRATRLVDGRGGIQSVTGLAIEKTPNGAIVRATGVASTQGQFNAQLVPVSNEGGVLTLVFRIEGVANAATNAAFSRQVTVARVLTFADLTGVRTIRVQSATNQRSASR
ncbi:MAG: hypothetical protein ACI9HB_000924 [Gammaproteobacteria bacterium]|jgi:hypothetical protein